MKIVYVTGCLGFMGSYFTRKCLEKGWMVYGIDKKTYAADMNKLFDFRAHDNFHFQQVDIKDLDHLYDCDYIINFAAIHGRARGDLAPFLFSEAVKDLVHLSKD